MRSIRTNLYSMDWAILLLIPKKWAAEPIQLISLGIRVSVQGDNLSIEKTFFRILDDSGAITVREIQEQGSYVLNAYYDSINLIIANRKELELVWRVNAKFLWEKHINQFLSAHYRSIRLTDFFKTLVWLRFNIMKIRKFIRARSQANKLLTYHVINCETHKLVATTALLTGREVTKNDFIRYREIVPIYSDYV